jgi:hypothetical protein
VAFFAYRRADLVARTLAALRANGVTLIHAFSDGARGDGDKADVAEVRRVLRSVDWADLRLVERPVNLGIDGTEAGIVRGITETLALHEEIVVCEDDIELAPGAYGYLVAALERYRAAPRVMSVSGWTHARLTPDDAHDAPHFTGRFVCWGWATWRRAWSGFPDSSAGRLRDACAARGIDIGKYGNDITALFADRAAKVTWDYCFSLHMMLHDGLTLLPPRTMAAHIGYDVRATHPQASTGWEDHPESPPPPATIRWPEVREHPASAGLYRRWLDVPPRPSLVGRIRRRLARLIGARADAETRA